MPDYPLKTLDSRADAVKMMTCPDCGGQMRLAAGKEFNKELGDNVLVRKCADCWYWADVGDVKQPKEEEAKK